MYEQHEPTQGSGFSDAPAEGTPVYDSSGEQVGTVSGVDPTTGALTVRHGHIFGHEYTAPREVVARMDPSGVYLNVQRDALKAITRGEVVPTEPRTDTAVMPSSIAPASTTPIVGVRDAVVQARDTIGSAVAATGGAVQAVQQTAGQAAQAAQQAAGETLNAARREAEGAKGLLHDKAQESMVQASDGLSGAAAAVGQVSEGLRRVDHGMLSQYTDRAAQQLEDFATRLREMTPEQALHEVEQLARRQPALFMAAAFAVGLLGARVLHGAGTRDTKSDEQR